MQTAISALVFALLLGSTAFAGGPVVVVEDEEVVVQKPASSTGLLPLLLIPVAICIFLCGNDADQPSG